MIKIILLLLRTNHKMAPSIPDRWIPYKACGKVIEGTRFISFKVPLRKAVQQGKEEITEIWDINALLQTLPNLGAVIDLTNTSRYYNPLELQKAGILYKKILMPGRIIPPEKKVNEFMDAVDEFLGKKCEAIIGVHCTHGLNRTGYMVCRYMRDRMGIDAKEAIRKFEIARGYKIERSNYIADLIGKKPPPPDVRKNTKVRPIEDTEKDEGHVSSKGAGRYSDKYSSSTRNLEMVGSWRDICVGGNEDDASGRYVRHPNSNFCRNERQASSSRNQESNSRYGSNYRTERSSSTDSDKSYDFRYDY